MTDIEFGKMVVDKFNQYFNRYWLKTVSYDDLARSMGMQTAIMLDGLGTTYRFLGESESDLNESMENLARASGGNLPKFATFSAAMRDVATHTFSFADFQQNTNSTALYLGAGFLDKTLDAFKAIGDTELYVGDSALETTKKAADAVNNTAWLLKWGLPLIVIAGLGLYAVSLSAPQLLKGKGK